MAWTVGYPPAKRVAINLLLISMLVAVVGADVALVVGVNRRWPNAMRTASIWLAVAGVCFVVAAFLSSSTD